MWAGITTENGSRNSDREYVSIPRVQSNGDTVTNPPHDHLQPQTAEVITTMILVVTVSVAVAVTVPAKTLPVIVAVEVAAAEVITLTAAG